MLQTTLKLKSGTSVPALGFGTWQLKGKTCYDSVRYALEVGYKHVDTAAVYENQREVGKAIVDSKLKREELFLTSKIWRSELAASKVRPACEEALADLGMEYIDLYLIHWPDKNIPIAETLEELNKLKTEGKIKHTGVSNFTIHHLKDVLATGVDVECNQVEFHPSLNQSELLAFCNEQKVVLTAYSPIAQGAELKLPEVIRLADKYKRSTSQVILNWIISKGMIAIPRSSTPKHITDNFKTLEWQLAAEDVAAIDKLNTNYRQVDPDFAEFAY